ncbi:hypothetical protein [Anaerobiospirillum sp. NML120511]|uniref:hypothetical protein n=1 Tax=Anaerobiospirillum sp. NML120511 TaxID=2932819 RepID=UPI001FF5AA7D|nr:hypothetical protein [Anaerobiospirillum sp. NML120511]MCK0535287.1 hypothetical protein [Anaerobiospirillum sp. NML120511]
MILFEAFLPANRYFQYQHYMVEKPARALPGQAGSVASSPISSLPRYNSSKSTAHRDVTMYTSRSNIKDLQ